MREKGRGVSCLFSGALGTSRGSANSSVRSNNESFGVETSVMVNTGSSPLLLVLLKSILGGDVRLAGDIRGWKRRLKSWSGFDEIGS